MASNHTNVQATSKHGDQLSINHVITDSPALPAGNLEHLQRINPKLVDWVVEQTEIEAAHRRQSENRINCFVFVERVSGVVAGALVSLFGFAVGGYLVLKGHDWAGVAISGTTLATIVTVLVTKQRSSIDSVDAKSKRKVKTTKPIAPKR